MSKEDSTMLIKLLDEFKKVEENLIVKKGKNLYKNLKKYINCKSKINKIGKGKE